MTDKPLIPPALSQESGKSAAQEFRDMVSANTSRAGNEIVTMTLRDLRSLVAALPICADTPKDQAATGSPALSLDEILCGIELLQAMDGPNDCWERSTSKCSAIEYLRHIAKLHRRKSNERDDRNHDSRRQQMGNLPIILKFPIDTIPIS